MRRYQKFILTAALVVAISAIYAAPTEAQRRFGPRTRVFVSAHVGYPYYAYSPFYRPYWGYYPWSWWSPYYFQGYPPPWVERERYERTIGIRTDITPEETQIYVDGYFSGTASDFDGAFKRLRLPPGQHEIVLYLKGYKTIRQTLDLQSGQDYRIRHKLQPLAAGESNEPPPTPPPQRPQSERATEPPEAERDAPRIPAPTDAPERRAPRPPREREREGRVEAQGYGSLSVRVQPAGAEVLIDGERWQGPEGAGPLEIQLAEGRHRVEVRKEGYIPFITEVQVRQGQTSPLNVSLPQAR